MEKERSHVIELGAIVSRLWERRKVFFKVLPVVLVLSAIYIFPQPRYYRAEVALAPETGGTELSGGLASIASSFGFNLGGLSSNDAIYPLLYPELFDSPQFLVSLFDIEIRTADGELQCDYYTYLKDHQKKNPYTKPFKDASRWVKSFFISPKKSVLGDGMGINAFSLSERDFSIMEGMKDKITCTNDKQTDVTTIKVEAQDALVCALLADSICARLQNFLIQYRTSKARMDLAYYQSLSDSALLEYEASAKMFSDFCDSKKSMTRQTDMTRREQLQAEMTMRQTTYQAYQAQVQAMRSKVQEKTPAFTMLRSATVPIKPAGPKRILFMLGMCMFATLITAVWLVRDMVFK